MAITEEQVFSAAEEIRGSGRFPSAISIREVTKTGSLGTIQKHLRKWRHRETVSAANNNPPPEEVLDSLRNFGDSFWRLALQHSDKAALQKVRLARDEQDEARHDMEEALENLEKQGEKNDAMAKEVEELLKQQNAHQIELGLQKDMVQKASLQCHKLEETLKSLDERYREIEDREKNQRQTITQLNEQVEEIQDNNHNLQHLLDTAEATKKKFQEENETLSHDLNEAKQLSDVQKSENKDLMTKLVDIGSQLDLSNAKRETQHQELQEEKQLNKELQTELRDNQVKLESTNIVNERLEALLEKLNPNNKT